MGVALKNKNRRNAKIGRFEENRPFFFIAEPKAGHGWPKKAQGMCRRTVLS